MTDTIEETEFAAELAPDMERVGITVGNEAIASLAEQQAALTLVMRRMHAIQKGLDVQDDAHVLEVRALTDMHQMQTRSERERLQAFKRYALTLAEVMEWGKKKSHDSPYGTAGVRDTAAGVECTDRHSLARWAAMYRSDLTTVEMTIPLERAREVFLDAEIDEMGELDVKWKELKPTLDPSGELPPGVVMTPAARTPFVKI